MMSVKMYAEESNLSVAEILKKCQELGIEAKNGDYELSEDDVIILDNTINLISTENDTSLDEEDVIDEVVEDLAENINLSKNITSQGKKQKLKKKSQIVSSKEEYLSKRKEMYKHKEKLMTNNEEDDVVLYHENMTVQELATALEIDGTDIITKLMSLGLMVSLNNPIDFENASLIAM